MNQPTTHVLESTPESISSGTLDPSRPPALTIDSGDIVSCPNTWTQWGNQARFGMSFADREPLRRQFPSGPYSNLGPVEVRGAEPSQVGCSGVTGRARRRVAGSSRRRGRDHLLGWGGGDARVRAVGVGSGGKVRDLLGLDGRLGGFGEEERHRFGGEVAALHEASSFCSKSSAPAGRITAWSLGKIPTTSERRPISLFTRSSGFVERILVQCSRGNA